MIAAPAAQFGNFTYTDNGTSITITDYPSDAPGSSYLAIPATINSKPVKSIGNGAFSYCTQIVTLSIPSSVTAIGSAAFANCTGLTSVTIPSAVTSIGNDTFSNCPKLTGVTLPTGMKTIGNSAFRGSGLTSLILPTGLTSIGSYAFAYCDFASVTIPSSVTSISNGAFASCWDLTSITADPANPNYSSESGILFNESKTILLQYPARISGDFSIPSTVTSLGSDAFYRCTGFSILVLPSSVTTIGDRSFSDCLGLTSVTIPSGVTTIGTRAFAWCMGLTSVIIPASVSSIGNEAFGFCGALTSLVMDSENPNYASENGVLFNKPKTTLIQCPAGKSGVYKIPFGVNAVGYGGFSGCDELTRITIPSGVNLIAESAFLDCSKLTSVTIPASISIIERYAFSQNYKLTGVYFMGNAPATGTVLFSGLGAGFKVYYFNSRSGFTSPTWKGYPSVAMGDETPVNAWLISHNLPHDSNLQSDPNGDGVNSLMAYALDLDPNENLNGSMPKPAVTESQMGLKFFAGAAGITYVVETSTDLQSWRVDDVTISGPDANQFRAATVNRSGPVSYMRLRVSQ